MDDDRLPLAIRRAFSRYEMRAPATLPIGRVAQPARPGHRRSLPRLAGPVVAAAAVAVIVAGTLVPAQPAFASWSATPSTADPAVVASARDDCSSVDPDHLGGLQLVTSEQRGDYTMLLFGDGEAYGLCLTGRDIEPMILAGPGTGAVDLPDGSGSPGDDHSGVQAAPGVRFVAQPGSDSAIAERVQAWVIGVTPEVARVVIEREGAEPTIATLGDEVAFAWWPAGTEAVAIVAYGADGEVLQRITVNGSMVSEH